ncbi:MAG: restriction endonuclease [Armatimonadetes bacterium]|nr:restriction endonuclease [Armatimonadota bacterium]
MNEWQQALTEILSQYSDSFSSKTYGDENNDIDVLMDVFSISPELKRENRQYWGRELGMCWQLIITALFRVNCQDFAHGYRDNNDELCDLMCGLDAIDTKYRIGSGDSGTLKKFKQYGKALTAEGFRPVLLIVRDDNLPAALTACITGGWTVYTAQQTFDYICTKTGIDLQSWLRMCATSHCITRGSE